MFTQQIGLVSHNPEVQLITNVKMPLLTNDAAINLNDVLVNNHARLIFDLVDKVVEESNTRFRREYRMTGDGYEVVYRGKFVDFKVLNHEYHDDMKTVMYNISITNHKCLFCNWCNNGAGWCCNQCTKTFWSTRKEELPREDLPEDMKERTFDQLWLLIGMTSFAREEFRGFLDEVIGVCRGAGDIGETQRYHVILEVSNQLVMDQRGTLVVGMENATFLPYIQARGYYVDYAFHLDKEGFYYQVEKEPLHLFVPTVEDRVNVYGHRCIRFGGGR